MGGNWFWSLSSDLGNNASMAADEQDNIRPDNYEIVDIPDSPAKLIYIATPTTLHKDKYAEKQKDSNFGRIWRKQVRSLSKSNQNSVYEQTDTHIALPPTIFLMLHRKKVFNTVERIVSKIPEYNHRQTIKNTSNDSHGFYLNIFNTKLFFICKARDRISDKNWPERFEQHQTI